MLDSYFSLRKLITSHFFQKTVILLSSLSVFCLAWSVPFHQMHADEPTHLSACLYFGGRFFPPNLGSDEPGVSYGAYGLSRVFYQEFVYIIYGNIGKLWELLTGTKTNYLFYRILQVILWSTTLGVIFRQKDIKLIAIGYVLICIPQIPYLYAYINSDAWALSINLFLFIWVARPKPIEQWSITDWVILGILTGFLLTVKKNFLIGGVIPYALLLGHLLHLRVGSTTILSKPFLLAWCTSIFIIAAPLKIFYPITQVGLFGNFDVAIAKVKDERALPGFKPSTPGFFVNLRKQGYQYTDIFLDKKRPYPQFSWQEIMVKSFWAAFGKQTTLTPPTWVYSTIKNCSIALLMLTGLTLLEIKLWQDNVFLIGAFIGIFVLIINWLLAIYYAWTIDYQAQGRYLFPSVIPIALWLTGTLAKDNPLIANIRILLLLIMGCLSSFSLLMAFFALHG